MKQSKPMPDEGSVKSLAVLIDADNTSARHAEPIFDEIVKLGEANVRRVYGDFSSGRLAGWDDAVKSLAILQHQQRNNTKGKNAADIALVIDAMDLMHKGNMDGFCLVSSDSDFTRLAQRLREDGQLVYGFGERKTPEAFRNACNRFIYVENLEEATREKQEADGEKEKVDGKEKTDDDRADMKEPPGNAAKIIAKALGETDDDWTNLGTVGSRIAAAKPDFDSRTYDCSNLSTLVTKCGGFEMKKVSNVNYIRRKSHKKT